MFSVACAMISAMNLKNYLSSIETAASLARKLIINEAFISQWKSGRRPVPVERCLEIERATDGHVSRKDLRPTDWHLIWPELE